MSDEQLCDRDRALVVVFDGAVAPTIEDAQPLQAAQLRHQGLPADRAVDLGFLGLGIGIPAVEVWEDAPPRGIPLAVELGLAEGRLSLAGLLPDGDDRRDKVAQVIELHRGPAAVELVDVEDVALAALAGKDFQLAQQALGDLVSLEQALALGVGQVHDLAEGDRATPGLIGRWS